jgi:hypothetical protein
MRLSDYRQNEPKGVITRQVILGSLFLYLTGCNITGINNPLPDGTQPQESPLDQLMTIPQPVKEGTPASERV